MSGLFFSPKFNISLKICLHFLFLGSAEVTVRAATVITGISAHTMANSCNFCLKIYKQYFEMISDLCQCLQMDKSYFNHKTKYHALERKIWVLSIIDITSQLATVSLEIAGNPSAQSLQRRVQPAMPVTLIHLMHVTTFCFSSVSNMLRVTTGAPIQITCDLLVRMSKRSSPYRTKVKQST